MKVNGINLSIKKLHFKNIIYFKSNVKIFNLSDIDTSVTIGI